MRYHVRATGPVGRQIPSRALVSSYDGASLRAAVRTYLEARCDPRVSAITVKVTVYRWTRKED